MVTSLILMRHLFSLHQRIPHQKPIIQLFAVQMHCRDLVIVIGGVIIDSFIRVAAGGVLGHFKTVAGITTAPRLADGTQNMKELTDTF